MSKKGTFTFRNKIIDLNQPIKSHENLYDELINLIRDRIIKLWPSKDGVIFFIILNGKHKKLFEYKFINIYDYDIGIHDARIVKASDGVAIHYHSRYDLFCNKVKFCDMEEYHALIDKLKDDTSDYHVMYQLERIIFTRMNLVGAMCNERCIMEYVPDNKPKFQELTNTVKALEEKIDKILEDTQHLIYAPGGLEYNLAAKSFESSAKKLNST